MSEGSDFLFGYLKTKAGEPAVQNKADKAPLVETNKQVVASPASLADLSPKAVMEAYVKAAPLQQERGQVTEKERKGLIEGALKGMDRMLNFNKMFKA